MKILSLILEKNSPTLSEWIAAMISIAMEVTENMAEREQTGTQDRAVGNTGSRERWLGFKGRDT